MMKEYQTANDLAHHPFSDVVFENAMSVSGAITVFESVLKVNAEYKRDPSEAEFYCIATGKALAHLLSICVQLEHSILYFSSFTPTEKMKKARISRQSHLYVLH
jgi:hypothetical protein